MKGITVHPVASVVRFSKTAIALKLAIYIFCFAFKKLRWCTLESRCRLLKGSVQQKLRWVLIGANCWVLAWDCGAGHYFDFLLCRCLTLDIFPFPVTTAELIGEFYNNRRSAAHGCPRFAYSFVFLMLRHYYWRYDSCTANRRSAANRIKKSAKTTYWRCEFASLRL